MQENAWRAAGARVDLIAGMAVVLVVAFTTPIAFLWHNLIGAAVVVIVGMAISVGGGASAERRRQPLARAVHSPPAEGA